MSNRILSIRFAVGVVMAVSASWISTDLIATAQEAPPCDGSYLEPIPGSPCEDFGGGWDIQCSDANREEDCMCFRDICQNPPDGEAEEIWDCCQGGIYHRVQYNIQRCGSGEDTCFDRCEMCIGGWCGWFVCYRDYCCVWNPLRGCVQGGELCYEKVTNGRMNVACDSDCQLALNGNNTPVAAGLTRLARDGQR